MTFLRDRQRSALYLHWRESDGITPAGQLITLGGRVVGTFNRTGVKRAVDVSGRVYVVPEGQPAWHYALVNGGVWTRMLLLEGASTNLALHSQDFSNAAWVKSNVTVGPNEAIAPDGSLTADTLTATAGNGTVIQDLGVIGSAVKAGGLWLRRKTGTGNIDLTLDGGSTWTTKAISSLWARPFTTQTLANPDFGIRLVTSGDAVWAWQGQVEALPVLTSDIVTAGATANRGADVATLPMRWLPRDCAIYADMVDLGTFQLAGARFLQVGDDDAGLASSATLQCETVGDVRLRYENASAAETADASSGAGVFGDRHEIVARPLASGILIARSINGGADVSSSAATALAHAAAHAEEVLSLTPTGCVAHGLVALKIGPNALTFSQLRAVA